MDDIDVASVTLVGEQLFTFKLLLTSVQCLWIYDYLLTLGDEVAYAWGGGKSWVFVLFIANRYTPVVHLIWVHTTMFHYEKPFCQETKWIPLLHATIVATLAQIVIGLRVYAMTGRNKLIGGALALMTAAQFCFGGFSIVWVALRPLESFPEIDLDAFKLCAYKQWRLGELLYYNLTICFDVLAFLTVIVTARRSGRDRYPGMPTVVDNIVQDSTRYFVFIFLVQFVAQMFVFFAPGGIQLLPGTAGTILVPVMASRIMLSLKKASVQPKMPWCLETLTTVSYGRSEAEDGTVRFAPQGRLREASQNSVSPNEEDMELDAVT